MNGLHQLNLRYESIEDRLLLLIRTTAGDEIRVWLTRRFTRLLQGVLEGAEERMVDQVLGVLRPSLPVVAAAPAIPAQAEPEPPAAAPLNRERVKAFQREHALSAVDLSSEYVEKAVAYPMGEAPLLASRIESRFLDNGEFSLTFAVGEEQGINLALDRDHLFAFVKMMEDGAVVAEWDLPARRREEGAVAAAGIVH